ncbi:MAG: tail-specific protease [Planctomycetes bacterium]|nr:tail-specific protease [Planctomycetota bacterium]
MGSKGEPMRDFRLFNWRAGRLSIAVAVVAGVVAAVGVWRCCIADLTGPTSMDRHVAQTVSKLVTGSHLSQRPINDEISRRAFKLFLESLDPLKMYFHQSDVDEFKRFEVALDDMLARNDTSFAYVVFQRFLQRVQERVAMVDGQLKQEFDFTVDEEMVTDPDLLNYPRSVEEAAERWRQRLKYDLLVLKAGKTEGPAAREKLSKRYQGFARRMKQFDNDELLEMYLSAITSSFDPHTTYMSPGRLKNFTIQMSLELDGIGAQLQDRDGMTVVAEVVRGGAADKDGKLKKDDQIISVGQGENGELEDVVGMKLNDVVDKIRGKAGTVVRLGVIPSEKNEAVIYQLTRAKIKLEDSAAHGEVFEVGTGPAGQPMKIGVVDLPSFYLDMEAARFGRNYRSATRDVRKILEDFTQRGVDAVVLDLRYNGGGSLSEAVELTGLFIDQGPVVQVQGYDKEIDLHVDSEAGMAWSGPLIVLTSKFSASASEILAGAVQDYHRGLIVGDETTHGKGTVQTLKDVAKEIFSAHFRSLNLGALKLTVQQYFRPNGDSTQLRGVLSDVVLPSVTNYMDVAESDLEYPIEFRRVARAAFTPATRVSPELLTTLRQLSAQRIGQSEEFAKLLKRIDSYRTRKARKAISLNEEKFFADRDTSATEEDEEERLQEQLKSDNKIQRDYYLDEVLAITGDYVNALKHNNFAKVN